MPAERPVPSWKPIPDLGADSRDNAVRRATARVALFTVIRDGEKPEATMSDAEAKYTTGGKDLWEDPERVLARDRRIAMNAQRGFGIRFGQDGVDTVFPVELSLTNLIDREQAIIDRGGSPRLPAPRTRRTQG